jgi:tape measure domain-containing protein
MGRRSLDVAAQFEQTQVAFTTLIGSAQAGKAMLMDLYQFAASTPFEIPTVLQGARFLTAMQFSPKDIKPIMTTVGDAASGLGLGQERLQLLLYHFGQIRSEGKLTNVVLREMGRDGIGAAEMIAEAMGVPISQVKKLATEGIDANTAINALLKGMNEQFGGMMADQMSTLSGQFSNLKDQVTLTAVAIGNTLLPFAKDFVQWGQSGLSVVRELAQWFGNLPQPIQAGALALTAMVAAAGPLLAALGGLGLLIPQLLAGLAPIAAALGIGTGAFLGWAAAIAAAVAALVSLGVWVSNHWEGVKAALVATVNGGGGIQAFREADQADQAKKTHTKDLSDAEHDMRLDAPAPPVISTIREAWIEKHRIAVEREAAAMEKLEAAYKAGEISAEKINKARHNFYALENQQPPEDDNGEKEKKAKAPKIDRNALDALSGQHAHDEAALAFRKAEIEHEYQMAQPGSADRNESASNAAAEQIKAAEQRKQELDQIALEELQKTQQNLAEKLKLYRGDQAGHQALIEDKQKAEDKFLQTIQKNAFDLETVKKQANDRIAAEEQKAAEDREKRQQKEYEMALKTVDLKVQGDEKALQQQIKQHEFEATMEDKRLQFELETGTLSKNQYLRLKQEQYDEAFAMEMAAIQKERDEIEKEFANFARWLQLTSNERRSMQTETSAFSH